VNSSTSNSGRPRRAGEGLRRRPRAFRKSPRAATQGGASPASPSGEAGLQESPSSGCATRNDLQDEAAGLGVDSSSTGAAYHTAVLEPKMRAIQGPVSTGGKLRQATRDARRRARENSWRSGVPDADTMRDSSKRLMRRTRRCPHCWLRCFSCLNHHFCGAKHRDSPRAVSRLGI